MKAAETIRLIAAREAGDRLRNKAFVWGTSLSLLLVVGAVVVPTFFTDDGPASYELGVVGAAPDDLGESLTAALAGQDAEVEVTALSDADAAAEAVEEGEVDAALLDGERLMADGTPPAPLHSAVDDALRQRAVAGELEDAGIPPDALARALGGYEPVTLVDPAGDTEQESGAGAAIAFAATVLLFVAIQFNGNSLLTGAIEEKSSRVVEVLLGTVRPWHLLAGKLIALTGLALGQVTLFVGASLGANAVVDAFDVPPATGGIVAISVLMIVVGFAFYAALYTVAGALASSVEDAQSTAGPLAFATIGAYFVAIFAVIPAPDGLLSQVLTYLPPTGPFIVPARVALGAMGGVEVALASLIAIAGTLVTIRLAGRLYAAAVLSGGKLTWRDAWHREPVG